MVILVVPSRAPDGVSESWGAAVGVYASRSRWVETRSPVMSGLVETSTPNKA
jgi:hypothetical protein